jgi:hypothetical protein
MKHRVAELEGAPLNAAVSRADGCADGVVLPYSSEWEWAGPIIERESICLVTYTGRSWAAYISPAFCSDFLSPSPLMAAMRAYVASKYGETVDLPD